MRQDVGYAADFDTYATPRYTPFVVVVVVPLLC
jgi:hypothetical protein